MGPLHKGRLSARLACSPEDIGRAQALRYRAFRADPAATAAETGRDADAFDALCRHVLIEETPDGTLLCCLRLLPLSSGREIARSYSAQFYELSALARLTVPMLEMGRFCVHPERSGDPDILRLAWAAVARMVDAGGARLLFGCASFPGTRAEAHRDALALLGRRHLAPLPWRPGVKAPKSVPFARQLRDARPDPRRAALGLPPLLRSYLAMGGWVSDHAVVDEDLGTLHVFTGLEVAAIPPARVRALRATAAA